jgi:hypothetical protein
MKQGRYVLLPAVFLQADNNLVQPRLSPLVLLHLKLEGSCTVPYSSVKGDSEAAWWPTNTRDIRAPWQQAT